MRQRQVDLQSECRATQGYIEKPVGVGGREKRANSMYWLFHKFAIQ